MTSKELTWQAYEYNYHEKTSDWFWALWIITISLAVASILFKNTLFAIFLVLASLALSLYAKREPEIITCRLTDRGLQFGKTLYPYQTLDSFWVNEDMHPKIIVQSKKVVMPLLIIPIGNLNPAAVRDFLTRYLREEEHQEPLTQKIMDFLGF